MLTSPRQHLREMMAFMLGITEAEFTGTVAERRIDEVLAMGTKSNQVYKPRQSGYNKNLIHYTPDMIEYVKEKAGDLLHFFGYADVDEALLPEERQSICATPFFKVESTLQ